MKRFLVVAFLALNVAGLPAQADGQSKGWSQAEAEENYKMLKGHVDDLIDARTDQDKRLDNLTRQIIELREQVAKLSSVSYATPEQVKRLAEAIQEVDRKRQADFETLHNEMRNNFAELKKLVEASIAAIQIPAPPPPVIHHPKPPPVDQPETKSKETVYEYQVKKGDQFGLIVQAYRDQGVKVTRAQVLKANPDLDPDKLKVNQKIFIPAGDSTKPEPDKDNK